MYSIGFFQIVWHPRNVLPILYPLKRLDSSANLEKRRICSR